MPRSISPRSLRILSIAAIGKIIQITCQNLVRKNGDKGEEMIEVIQNIYTSLPYQLVDEVFSEVINKLNSFAYKLELPLNDDISLTISNILKVMCDSRTSKLNLPSVKVIRDKIIDHLQCMTNLRYLRLHSVESAKRNALLDGVSRMKLLESFNLSSDCTDEIITVLAQNCEHLKYLHVYGSKDVTDEGMIQLYKCKVLLDLDIEETSVSSHGCAEVIKNVVCLKKISFYPFSPVMEELSESSSLSVEEIPDSVSISQLSLVRKIFPSLIRMELDIENGVFDPDTTPSFSKLLGLSISDGHFYESNIDKFLDSNGFNLVDFEINDVECLDLNALRKIAERCPSLKSLALSDCNDSNLSLPTSCNWSKTTYPNLDSLGIISCQIDIEYIISNSPNLTHLEISEVPHMSGDLLEKIFSRHSYKHLKYLGITPFEDISLTFACVYKIIKGLQNLEYFECEAVFNEDELSELQTYSSDKNLDVHIMNPFQ